MRVLVLSSVFPNAKQPDFGVFVRERTARVAAHCELLVVAPVPWFPFNRFFRGAQRTGIPHREVQGALAVHHPRFLSLPGIAKCLDGLFYFLSLLPVVARLRRRFPFDLIDAHFAYPDGMAAWLLGKTLGCPVSITLRGTIVPLSRFALRRAQIRWTLRSVARVISVSRSLEEVAVGLGVPPGKVRVIPNGIDTEMFRPRPRNEARRELALPAHRPVILSVGALSARKGHKRLLEILPRVVRSRPDTLCIVVGGPGIEGDTTPLLRELIQEHGLRDHVLLTGARPHREIPTWLAAADLFCLVTSNEGNANVLLEALATGLPVVATDVGGNREIVRDGTNGLLVPLGDGERLAAALLAALEAPWDRPAIAACARARSWDATAAEVLAEFRSVLPDKRKEPAGMSARPRPWMHGDR